MRISHTFLVACAPLERGNLRVRVPINIWLLRSRGSGSLAQVSSGPFSASVARSLKGVEVPLPLKFHPLTSAGRSPNSGSARPGSVAEQMNPAAHPLDSKLQPLSSGSEPLSPVTTPRRPENQSPADGFGENTPKTRAFQRTKCPLPPGSTNRSMCLFNLGSGFSRSEDRETRNRP
jgi:hypothetical protein